MIIKCKMCGGDLHPAENATTCECEYCGSVQTLPKQDNERRLNLYDRANHFRRNNEYDKAMNLFEQILQEDRTDAEAYWSIVLCRYGIEYVEDPVSRKRIPTVNRTQFTSIYADEDYKSALEYADPFQKSIYEEEARAIDGIQKGILEISRQEKPFDVFICYKETDANGRRTPDSVLANDLYHELTKEGFKVFFSRITLEDKIGTAYEPYIFAALNSAKVMVVLGTKPEYFNAVWVKNEWSRYLALIRAGADKVLVPAYRDMDPYDLPEEFSHLQAQDMGKLGFMQDLIRGIRKLTAKEEASSPQPVVQRTAAGTNVENLMKRVHLFMEDGDTKSAKEYLDKVLDENAEYAPAYVCLVCNDCGFRNEEMLRKATFLFEDHPDWQKAMRFAAPDQRKMYEDWQAEVRERVNDQISQYACDCASEIAVRPGTNPGKLESELAAYRKTCQWDTVRRSDGSRRVNGEEYEAAFQQAVQNNEPGDISEEQLKTAAEMFEAAGNEAAAKYAGQCRMLAEQARQKNIYKTAKTYKLQGRSAVRLEEAAKGFLSVPEYKDARVLAQQCLDEAAKIREEKYSKVVSQMKDANDSQKWKEVVERLSEEDLNGYRDVEQLRQQASQQYKKIIEDQEQEKAKSRREAEAAAARKKRNKIIAAVMAVVAVAMFFIITEVIIPGINYRNAVTLQRAGNYEDAIEAFTALGEYSDSEIQVKESRYLQAMAMMKTGNYEAAIEAFTALGDYSDAATQLTETKYLMAKQLAAKGGYAGAFSIFNSIKGYKDVDSLLATDENLLAVAREAKLKPWKTVGSYVTYGTYPQTKAGTDATPIEWLVLDVQGNKALLISRYALDCQSYNTEYKDITWEKCTLRTWLNSEFVSKAFSADEQNAILKTQVDNSNSQGYSDYDTSGGNNTQDKIFLLSYAEAWKYFADDVSRRCAPTDYAVAQGGWISSSERVDGKATSGWWLRSPGGHQDYAACVSHDGSRNRNSVSYTGTVVRPAFWINLESDIF